MQNEYVEQAQNKETGKAALASQKKSTGFSFRTFRPTAQFKYFQLPGVE